ncbi:hypothetical protein [Salipiger marinus]|uniref:Uncharacterized protein n=1 Tax=Salipiger marinus TaxID=555512 RepID=A0A1G8PWH4_9RHOB|nr:hypothetical protein [Salipiger marinus]SDI96616.1 hypothetical protein SAMN04487993_1013151 [Salipiger marinus]
MTTFERNLKHLIEVRYGGNVSKAARTMKMNRAQLNRYLMDGAWPRESQLRRICDHFAVDAWVLLEPLQDDRPQVGALPRSSQEVLAVLWEWTDSEFAGSRYWGCHSAGGDGRIQQWQQIGARPLGAAVVTVTEGEGLHLLTTTPPAQEGGDA